MASVVTVQVPVRPRRADGSTDAERRSVERAIEEVFADFRSIERACTRFDPDSALMRANRRPAAWHRAPEPLYATLRHARAAFERTGGLFDPRIHDRLVDLGYDRSFHLMRPQVKPVERSEDQAPRPATAGPWRPMLLPGLRLVRLGGCRIDLGGIGKSVALSRSIGILRRAAGDFLVDAGGDIYAAGTPNPTAGWRIGVEPPSGEGGPLAVLEVRDTAVATSSTRIRRWRRGGRTVHHLVDPRTGQPGGDGLDAVTVVHPDPVIAETTAKVLFLSGAEGIADTAERAGVAALWAGDTDRVPDGLGMNQAMKRHVIWTRP